MGKIEEVSRKSKVQKIRETRRAWHEKNGPATKKNRPPKELFTEKNSGLIVVETAGVLTSKQQVERIMRAGITREMALKGQYDYGPSDQNEDGIRDLDQLEAIAKLGDRADIEMTMKNILNRRQERRKMKNDKEVQEVQKKPVQEPSQRNGDEKKPDTKQDGGHTTDATG